jgi:hydroxymethylpyrimidine pyrophosphatase-like HAD family hydrolase
LPSPVQVFFFDIDGVLAVPYRPYDIDGFSRLVQASRHPKAPTVAICTGRAYPYAEAVAQFLGASGPVLFEAGAGCFDLQQGSTRWHPALTGAVRAELGTIAAWLQREIVPGKELSFDFGKRAQAGVIGPNPSEVEDALPFVESYVKRNHPTFVVWHTEVSIDVVPRALTKADGIAWGATLAGATLEATAFMGDSNGDVGALERVAFAFAPQNAAPSVKSVTGIRVTTGSILEGALEAFEACITLNEAQARG